MGSLSSVEFILNLVSDFYNLNFYYDFLFFITILGDFSSYLRDSYNLLYVL